jgi:hypothetical protein
VEKMGVLGHLLVLQLLYMSMPEIFRNPDVAFDSHSLHQFTLSDLEIERTTSESSDSVTTGWLSWIRCVAASSPPDFCVVKRYRDMHSFFTVLRLFFSFWNNSLGRLCNKSTKMGSSPTPVQMTLSATFRL